MLCGLFCSCSEQGLLSGCGVLSSHWGGFSCCRAQALGARVSVVAVRGLSSCDFQALEHRLSTCGPQALVALWHVRSYWARDWTCVSCIGSRILYHWATREALFVLFNADAYLQKNIHIFGSAHVPHVRNLSVGNFSLIWGKPRIEETLSRIFQRRVFWRGSIRLVHFPLLPLPEIGVCVHNRTQKPHLPSGIIQRCL